MTRQEIEQELDRLYKELDFAHHADEPTVCRVCSVDTRLEALQSITEEIDFYEAALEEFNKPDDDGMDYIGLQLSQGMAVTHW